MNNGMKMLLGCLLLCVVTGCGNKLCGQWESESVMPAEAAKEFKLGKVTFNCDGTYLASAEEGGKQFDSKGKYCYCPLMKKLCLTPEGSDEKRTYEAEVKACKLMLEYETANEQEIEVVMKKTGCATDCKMKCCKKGSSCGKGGCGSGGGCKEEKKSACGESCKMPCCSKKS